MLMTNNPARLHALPVVGGGNQLWNTEPCPHGLRGLLGCPGCGRWHAATERRCRDHVLGTCAHNEPCPLGLHVALDEMRETLTVDLENVVEFAAKLKSVKYMTRSFRAQCVRLEVWHFADNRGYMLSRMLQMLPMVHQLVLPDWERDTHVLAFITGMVDARPRCNPQLREVIFMDGTSVPLWW